MSKANIIEYINYNFKKYFPHTIIMRHFIIFIILLFSFSSNGQKRDNFLGLKLQLSNGAFFTWSNHPTIPVPQTLEQSSSGLQYSFQSSFFYPTNYFNFGLGVGLSYRAIDIYLEGLDPPLYPKVFAMIEVGNAKIPSHFSFVLFPGYMLGSINKKGCFYIGGGPSFNIGKPKSRILCSICPYAEFHMGEDKNLIAYDRRMGAPVEYHYTLNFKTLTINLSCIIQLNFYKKTNKKM